MKVRLSIMDQNTYKNHPAFIAFSKSNVKTESCAGKKEDCKPEKKPENSSDK